MAKNIDIPKDKNIIKVPLEEAMPENYLPYAVEVAKDRALPDVRDGLKPVHRRIIYGAYMLKAFPDKPYYKSARIVGDILGKYHPHGDSSVYEAMVILAQNFTTRAPLIDGHGNWGSIDGDSAAAMRYTEARLTKIALEMIKDIDKGVVDMVDNYSGSEKEPEVLPARYPNILVNGAFGIAVGLATNIPPHNLKEVINGCLAYIDNNQIETKEIMNYIKGPDLPTGGTLIGKNSLLSAYETGQGKVTLRAKADIEKLENGKLAIVIKEFPYRKNKSKILQTISEMTADKKHAKTLEAIYDIRDESDRNGIRAVIEFKRSIDEETSEKVLKYLYKKTDLQYNLSFNMVALANGKPETMGLKTIIKYYVEHQKDVVTRRTKRELEIAEKRFHIVEGFIKAIGIMDEIIKTIRASKSKKDAHNNLVSKFGFTDIQSDAILELMLYRLTGLEIVAFEKEHKELEKQINKLSKILESEKELLKVIKKELKEVKETYGDERRTTIVENDEAAKIDLEELIIEEDEVITMSNEGFIKRIALKSYNRCSANVEDIEYREGDFNKYLISSNTKDTLMFFTDKGNMYQIKTVMLPELRWKEKGERLEDLIRGLDLSKENIIAVYSIDNITAQKDFMFFTSTGCIKKTALHRFNTNYSKIMALKLRKGENLAKIELVDRNRDREFIEFETLKGLKFQIEEPEIEEEDRNIVGRDLFSLPISDAVVKAEFVKEYNYKEFTLELTPFGKIKIAKNNKKSEGLKVFTNSLKQIVIFTKNGSAYSMPAYMIQNIGKKGIDIKHLIEDINKSNPIIKVLSVDDFNKEGSLYFFTKQGIVKRMLISELKDIKFSSIVYKFKKEKDEIINIEYVENPESKDIILVTEKAMCIRFDSSTVNPMGKIASGVNGINLNKEDIVVSAHIIDKDSSENMIIKTNKGKKETINLKEIIPQNRAGKGKNILLIIMDELLAEVLVS
ncbi:DNA gyrase subunit A [Clostridium acetireducens DSM 10703]|uniref:DNA topoisomerase (ATP-hydrolyzing) n=1 Tax=Clostridium acetireducens DSM 10703 TaxID=1121290 RepID=A0A1E8EY71_9CLOT|nr:DNA topoisomerase IV subunit A [Clostridium acetireducens]OFI05893.1 DNA gyrase subunit A [Clostridium acetireducens DSM 10703]